MLKKNISWMDSPYIFTSPYSCLWIKLLGILFKEDKLEAK